MPETAFLEATLPLFESGGVDIVEWSFDTVWESGCPSWLTEIVAHYEKENRLIGHGVTFSLLSGDWLPHQERWLACLERECRDRRYRWISEHFGFMIAKGFSQGAPLPVPFSERAVALGVERLKRFSQCANAPVGLENLAFAFGREDVRRQGDFLERLLGPVEGFLLLDLHNLYCQAVNFRVDYFDLLESYPLHRVKEIHLSGGSWTRVRSRTTNVPESLRRDTHDGAVPEELIECLGGVLRRCPSVEAVVLERLGNTLSTEEQAEEFRRDFFRIQSVLENVSHDE